MGLLNFVKESFQSSKGGFQEITPEFFKNQKGKMPPADYKKWLRKKTTQLEAALLMEKEMGRSVPQEWLDKLLIVEQERADSQ